MPSPAFCLWFLSARSRRPRRRRRHRNRDGAGKVLMLADALKARGLEPAPDAEPIAKQVVILGEDGTITPLLSDETSRALFLDERLRNRKAQIVGRRFAGVALPSGRHDSKSRARAGCERPSISAKSARSAFVIRRFARAARDRWNFR